MIDAKEVFEAEFSLVACSILDPTVIDRMESVLDSEDFGVAAHRKAWSAMVDLRAAGGPCSDVRQVLAMFGRLGIVDDLGGTQRLLDIRTAFPHHANHYANLVKTGSQWRKMDGLASKIRLKLESEMTPAEVAHWATAQMDSILGAETGVLQSIGDAADEALAAIEKARRVGLGTALTTGLDAFDSSFGGMFPSELVILAARPSIGKTALATQIAMHVANNHGPVMLASLEMKGTDLVLRMLARDTKISVRDLRSGNVSDVDLDEVRNSVSEIKKARLELLASRNVTPQKIRAAARLQANVGGLSLIVVDYLGLVKSSDPKKDKYSRVSDSCEALKDLAMELDVPVLCLSQLNRVAEKEKPGIHHLRDSGSVEQDADVVWLLHRETRASEEATIEVAKARQGATGEHKLKFNPSTTTFEDLSAKDMPNFEPSFAEWGGESYVEDF